MGAELDASRIPIDPAAAELAPRYGRDPLALALHGGEDYHLLCALAPDRRDEALAALQAVGCAPVVIGRLMLPEAGMALRYEDGSVQPLAATGWDHLSQGHLV